MFGVVSISKTPADSLSATNPLIFCNLLGASLTGFFKVAGRAALRRKLETESEEPGPSFKVMVFPVR